MLQKLQDPIKGNKAISELHEKMKEKFQKTITNEEIDESEFQKYLQNHYEGFILAFGNTSMYRSFLAFNPKNVFKKFSVHYFYYLLKMISSIL